jgi:uncharacterized membrane protein
MLFALGFLAGAATTVLVGLLAMILLAHDAFGDLDDTGEN